jgi:transcriptional regulator with XRE-family HTH domain
MLLVKKMLTLLTKPDERLAAIGRRLKAAREAAGLSQQEVATRAELHRVTVAKIEAGKIDITLTTLFALAEAVGVPYEQLTDDGSDE